MARTTGILLDVTDQAATVDGPWYQIEPGPEQVLAQITMTDNGTVTIEGRMGPGHDPVQLASVTNGDYSGLVNAFSQMRARVTAVGSPNPDVLVAVNRMTYL